MRARRDERKAIKAEYKESGDSGREGAAQDAGGRCAVSRLVRIEGDELYPATDLKLFMITTNAAIATTDCLFYAVSADGSTIIS